MKHRYRSITDVYVLLRRGDGQVLLLERANTGYADGQLCPAASSKKASRSSTAPSARPAKKSASPSTRAT